MLDRSDAEALGRDDPGSQFPERVEGTTETADGVRLDAAAAIELLSLRGGRASACARGHHISGWSN